MEILNLPKLPKNQFTDPSENKKNPDWYFYHFSNSNNKFIILSILKIDNSVILYKEILANSFSFKLILINIDFKQKRKEKFYQEMENILFVYKNLWNNK